MPNYYEISYVYKSIERDNYAKGEIPGGREIGSMDYQAKNADLRALVLTALKWFGLEPTYVFAPSNNDDDNDTGICRFTSSRMEDDNGDEPSKADMERFKAGEIDLWHATYDFSIRYVESRDLSREELVAALPGVDVEG